MVILINKRELMGDRVNPPWGTRSIFGHRFTIPDRPPVSQC
jgi:hypothetical protein